MISFRNNYISSDFIIISNQEKILKAQVQKSLKDYKVVIADRDLQQAKNLKSFLTQKGYDTLLVDRGKFLLTEIKNRDISLLFLDVKLLDIHKGYTLIPIIKQMRSNILIVITNNSNSYEIESQIRRHDILFYLLKPYDMSEIELLIKSSLKGVKDTQKNLDTIFS